MILFTHTAKNMRKTYLRLIAVTIAKARIFLSKIKLSIILIENL